MKVKLLAPIPGYSHFEGEVINLPDKIAKEAIENKIAEPVGKSAEKAEETISTDVDSAFKPVVKKGSKK